MELALDGTALLSDLACGGGGGSAPTNSSRQAKRCRGEEGRSPRARARKYSTLFSVEFFSTLLSEYIESA